MGSVAKLFTLQYSLHCLQPQSTVPRPLAVSFLVLAKWVMGRSDRRHFWAGVFKSLDAVL